jgi:hypothetical protein
VHQRRRGFGSKPIPALVLLVAYIGACALFVIVVFVRGGPDPAETDAKAVTFPTTAISHGNLAGAERQTLVPNPPGYPLLMAPVVLAFRPWIGSPRWCDDQPIPAILRQVGALYFRSILGPCTAVHGFNHGKPYPIWYRSQAVLGIFGWIVLAVGSVMLLRSTGAGGGPSETFLVVALALLPTASDAIAQTFHPQDLMSVGLACAGVSQALRRRWRLVGVLFGVAFLCKQFAILPLFAPLAAAPRWRDRAWTVGAAAAVIVGAVVPFYLADSVDTMHALTAVYVAGVNVVKTPTVLGVLNVAEKVKLDIARDLPLVVSAGLALWARRRSRGHLLSPAPIVGLTLACLATRLVFEVGIFNYYFLAVGVVFLILDLTLGRFPVLSVAWILVVRFGLSAVAPHAPRLLSATLYLVAALVPLAVGLAQVPRGTVSPMPESRPRSVAGRDLDGGRPTRPGVVGPS